MTPIFPLRINIIDPSTQPDAPMIFSVKYKAGGPFWPIRTRHMEIFDDAGQAGQRWREYYDTIIDQGLSGRVELDEIKTSVSYNTHMVPVKTTHIVIQKIAIGRNPWSDAIIKRLSLVWAAIRGGFER